jgi:hypothetical protein
MFAFKAFFLSVQRLICFERLTVTLSQLMRLCSANCPAADSVESPREIPEALHELFQPFQITPEQFLEIGHDRFLSHPVLFPTRNHLPTYFCSKPTGTGSAVVREHVTKSLL